MDQFNESIHQHAERMNALEDVRLLRRGLALPPVAAERSLERLERVLLKADADALELERLKQKEKGQPPRG